MLKYIKNWELINFIICGTVSAAIYFSILALLFEILKFNELISYSISYFISSAFNFFYNKKITFKSKNGALFELIKYLIMLGTSYLLGLYIIKVITISFGVSIYIASLVTIGLTTIFRFIASKKVVYKWIILNALKIHIFSSG